MVKLNSKALIFFENNKSSWSRFPKMIFEKIDGYNSTFIYNHEDSTSDIDFFSSSFCYKGDLKSITENLKSYEEIIVILFAFRPIDLFFLTHLKQKVPNCKSVMLQHGVYSDKLQRDSIFSFLSNTYGRVYSYLLTFLFSKSFSFKNKIFLINEIFFVYVLNNRKFNDSKLKKLLTLPENCLIYDEKWIKYFNENYYYDLHPKYDIIPPKDIDLLSSNKIIDIDSVVIVAQSLVEDGRYDRKNLIQEFKLLISVIPSKFKIYIKRHPRGDDSMYSNFSREVILTNKLVIAKHVISGYSSLMQLYSDYIESNVFSWKFKNHYNPSFFNSYSIKNGREKELSEFFKIPTKKIKTNFEKVDIGEIYFKKIIEITSGD